mmetsp:Transcript_116829/g.232852  ORF Transcript_116829/g.232852 Transcript_116829/m.232852 type:complete len:654 (+) Transcript_116829:53-2014(+)
MVQSPLSDSEAEGGALLSCAHRGCGNDPQTPYVGAWWRHVLRTGFLLAGLAAVGVTLSVMRLQPHPVGVADLSSSSQLQAVVVGDFYMCASFGNCGGEGEGLQSWRQSPALLATTVDPSLSYLQGIPNNVFRPVADHWQSSPPSFSGATVTLSSIASFMRELLSSDPFGTGGSVPYVTFTSEGDGQAVAITQRQLAFLVANVLMGNDIASGNGLSGAITRCANKGAKAFVYSLLSLLAVLSQELHHGGPGHFLIAMRPKGKDDSWKTRLDTTLVKPYIVKELGAAESDFMAGGPPGQALTDIAGTVVGGGAALCDLANSQDESLVQFYSEVLAFAFFVPSEKMLPVPWTLLGARRYMATLTGESASSGPYMNRCGHIAPTNWLNEVISTETANVFVNGRWWNVNDHAFVAVASKCSAAGGQCPNNQAVNNLCDDQRRHSEEDVNLWYQAFESTNYPEPLQKAFRTVVRRIGTGPWGAGVWFGDSQQYFLTVWLATSLLKGPVLDYYVYDHFCENPGNQCFVLGSKGCQSCIAQSLATNVQGSRCGQADLETMIWRFSGKQAKELYLALQNVGQPPAQVFDSASAWLPTPGQLATPVEPSSGDAFGPSGWQQPTSPPYLGTTWPSNQNGRSTQCMPMLFDRRRQICWHNPFAWR